MKDTGDKRRGAAGDMEATRRGGEQSHEGNKESGQGRGGNLTEEDRRKGGEHSHGGNRESGQGGRNK